MREESYYRYLFPSWIREDENFKKVGKGILDIFIDCQKVKEDIQNSYSLANILNYPSSLDNLAKYFNIPRNIYIENGIDITEIDYKKCTYTTNKESSNINIVLSDSNLLSIIKFKILQSNFDGTRKSLIENYDKLFKKQDNIIEDIQFIESSYYEENENPEGANYPVLKINMPIPEDPKEDFEQRALLFINGKLQFNYLGVNIVYSLGGRSLDLIWDKTNWDESYWKEIGK